MSTTENVWGPWVLAGAAGELVGLGLAGVIMAGGATVATETAGPGAMVVMFAATALAGLIEGGVVGAAQVAVLRRHLPVRPWRWVLATAIGSTAAWFLGMAAGAHAPPTPVSPWVFLLVSAVGGTLLGALLGFAQWIVLSRVVERSGVWILANAAAWGVGMVVAMAGASWPDEDTPLAAIGLVAVISGLAAGACTALITGGVLKRLVKEGRSR